MSVTKFFMQGCSHCTAMQEAWNKIKEKYGQITSEVDCSAENEVCSKAQIMAVPTVRYSVAGAQFDHVGERTFENIDASLAALNVSEMIVEDDVIAADEVVVDPTVGNRWNWKRIFTKRQ